MNLDSGLHISFSPFSHFDKLQYCCGSGIWTNISKNIDCTEQKSLSVAAGELWSSASDRECGPSPRSHQTPETPGARPRPGVFTPGPVDNKSPANTEDGGSSEDGEQSFESSAEKAALSYIVIRFKRDNVSQFCEKRHFISFLCQTFSSFSGPTLR